MARGGRRTGASASNPGDGVDAAEVRRRIGRLELRVRGLVESLLPGEHGSTFHGRGYEFSHVRPYHPGDDVRAIDWKVTARRDAPYVRQFVEERDMVAVLVVDVSASGRFGPGEPHAGGVAAEIAAAVAFAAVRMNDRVALVLASDRVEEVVPPGSGRKHVIRLLGDLLTHRPEGSGTDLVPALRWVARAGLPRGAVFLVSDFIRPGPRGPLRRALGRVGRRHDLVAVRLTSPAAAGLPDVGWMEMTDPESGRRVVLDTGAARVRRAFRKRIVRARAETAALLGEAGADLLDVDTAGDPLDALRAFYHRRQRVAR